MTKNELAKKIFEACYLTGEFKLRSGQISNEYFDKYRFEANPSLLKEVAKHLVPLIPIGTQVLAGLEMGGIPIATALSLEANLPIAFVRKEPKAYGTCLFAEGAEIKNKKVLVIEDVITTGGQVLTSVNDLRNSGAIIESVLCTILRGKNTLEPFNNVGLTLTYLFTGDELKSS